MNAESDVFIGLMDQPHVCNNTVKKQREKWSTHYNRPNPFNPALCSFH